MVIANQLYIGVLVRYFIYEDASFKKLLFQAASDNFYTGLSMLNFDLFIIWIGFLYLGSELGRTGNENLLNSLKEGVFIIEEESKSGAIMFQNEAAVRINERIQTKCTLNLLTVD